MRKWGKDRLPSKLVEIFRGTDLFDINKSVKEAKDRLNKESKQKRWGNYEVLFNSQLVLAKERGCPEQILEEIRDRKRNVLARAVEMDIKGENIPFLPIIKSSCLGYSGLMAMVRNGDKQGFINLPNLVAIVDLVLAPEGVFSYHIYDVENGKDNLGKSPQYFPQDFGTGMEAGSRLALIVAEVISLCVFTDVLSWRNVWAAASRYESSYGIPGVSLRGDIGRPSLTWTGISHMDGGWGTPSCGSR